jgi:hypothetical protein
MKERYRTVLGHFRHEIGHYYWGCLMLGSAHLEVGRRSSGSARVEAFRALFGDERADYARALERHYAGGEPAEPIDSYISSYAAAHPWEDWAETFAHYLHVADTLETARHFGFRPEPTRETRTPAAGGFDLLMQEWFDLTVALNALNRSMGLPDPYPFTISSRVREKLAFVHERIAEASERA